MQAVSSIVKLWLKRHHGINMHYLIYPRLKHELAHSLVIFTFRKGEKDSENFKCQGSDFSF